MEDQCLARQRHNVRHTFSGPDVIKRKGAGVLLLPNLRHWNTSTGLFLKKVHHPLINRSHFWLREGYTLDEDRVHKR